MTDQWTHTVHLDSYARAAVGACQVLHGGTRTCHTAAWFLHSFVAFCEKERRPCLVRGGEISTPMQHSTASPGHAQPVSKGNSKNAPHPNIPTLLTEVSPVQRAIAGVCGAVMLACKCEEMERAMSDVITAVRTQLTGRRPLTNAKTRSPQPSHPVRPHCGVLGCEELRRLVQAYMDKRKFRHQVLAAETCILTATRFCVYPMHLQRWGLWGRVSDHMMSWHTRMQLQKWLGAHPSTSGIPQPMLFPLLMRLREAAMLTPAYLGAPVALLNMACWVGAVLLAVGQTSLRRHASMHPTAPARAIQRCAAAHMAFVLVRVLVMQRGSRGSPVKRPAPCAWGEQKGASAAGVCGGGAVHASGAGGTPACSASLHTDFSAYADQLIRTFKTQHFNTTPERYLWGLGRGIRDTPAALMPVRDAALSWAFALLVRRRAAPSPAPIKTPSSGPKKASLPLAKPSAKSLTRKDLACLRWTLLRVLRSVLLVMPGDDRTCALTVLSDNAGRADQWRRQHPPSLHKQCLCGAPDDAALSMHPGLSPAHPIHDRWAALPAPMMQAGKWLAVLRRPPSLKKPLRHKIVQRVNSDKPELWDLPKFVPSYGFGCVGQGEERQFDPTALSVKDELLHFALLCQDVAKFIFSKSQNGLHVSEVFEFFHKKYLPSQIAAALQLVALIYPQHNSSAPTSTSPADASSNMMNGLTTSPTTAGDHATRTAHSTADNPGPSSGPDTSRGDHVAGNRGGAPAMDTDANELGSRGGTVGGAVVSGGGLGRQGAAVHGQGADTSTGTRVSVRMHPARCCPHSQGCAGCEGRVDMHVRVMCDGVGSVGRSCSRTNASSHAAPPSLAPQPPPSAHPPAHSHIHPQSSENIGANDRTGPSLSTAPCANTHAIPSTTVATVTSSTASASSATTSSAPTTTATTASDSTSTHTTTTTASPTATTTATTTTATASTAASTTATTTATAAAATCSYVEVVVRGCGHWLRTTPSPALKHTPSLDRRPSRGSTNPPPTRASPSLRASGRAVGAKGRNVEAGEPVVLAERWFGAAAAQCATEWMRACLLRATAAHLHGHSASVSGPAAREVSASMGVNGTDGNVSSTEAHGAVTQPHSSHSIPTRPHAPTTASSFTVERTASTTTPLSRTPSHTTAAPRSSQQEGKQRTTATPRETDGTQHSSPPTHTGTDPLKTATLSAHGKLNPRQSHRLAERWAERTVEVARCCDDQRVQTLYRVLWTALQRCPQINRDEWTVGELFQVIDSSTAPHRLERASVTQCLVQLTAAGLLVWTQAANPCIALDARAITTSGSAHQTCLRWEKRALHHELRRLSAAEPTEPRGKWSWAALRNMPRATMMSSPHTPGKHSEAHQSPQSRRARSRSGGLLLRRSQKAILGQDGVHQPAVAVAWRSALPVCTGCPPPLLLWMDRPTTPCLHGGLIAMLCVLIQRLEVSIAHTVRESLTAPATHKPTGSGGHSGPTTGSKLRKITAHGDVHSGGGGGGGGGNAYESKSNHAHVGRMLSPAAEHRASTTHTEHRMGQTTNSKLVVDTRNSTNKPLTTAKVLSQCVNRCLNRMLGKSRAGGKTKGKGFKPQPRSPPTSPALKVSGRRKEGKRRAKRGRPT